MLKKKISDSFYKIVGLIQMTLNTDEVKALATKWHEGQKRKDGLPYITHPEAVANIAAEILQYNFRHLAQKYNLELVRQMGLLHDILEDCEVTPNMMLEAGVDERVVNGCVILNKNQYQNYASYIESISTYNLESVVKYADLTHNLRGSDGNRKDKYELAKSILKIRQPQLRYAIVD